MNEHIVISTAIWTKNSEWTQSKPTKKRGENGMQSNFICLFSPYKPSATWWIVLVFACIGSACITDKNEMQMRSIYTCFKPIVVFSIIREHWISYAMSWMYAIKCIFYGFFYLNEAKRYKQIVKTIFSSGFQSITSNEILQQKNLFCFSSELLHWNQRWIPSERFLFIFPQVKLIGKS